MKRYLLSPLDNERKIEPIVMKKANEVVFFKFGNLQLLDIVNFLGAATSFDSFLKSYKTSKTKDEKVFSIWMVQCSRRALQLSTSFLGNVL